MNTDELERSLINLLRRWDSQDFGRIQPARNKPVDLTTARSADDPLEVPIQGEYMFADDDTTGKIYVRFGDKDSHRFPVQTGFTISNIDFKRVYLDWPAQTGKAVNLVYGVGARVAPPNIIGNISQIGSIANPVFIQHDQERFARAGSAWAATVEMAAVASEYSGAFLVNTSSDKLLIVHSVQAFHAGSTFNVRLRKVIESAAVANLASTQAGTNLYIDQPSSTAGIVYYGSHTANLGNPMSQSRSNERAVEMLPRGVVAVVPPDKSIGVQNPGVNLAMGASFFWSEEDV